MEIAYLVHNAVRFNAGYDEVYWNVTAITLSMPAEQVSATVVLPEKATESLRAQGFIDRPRGGAISGQ